MKNSKVMITGANGQIGKVLTERLRQIHGNDNVIATDIKPHENQIGPFEILDIQDAARLKSIAQDYKITEIYHLAALLSATGEADPLKTWAINHDAFIQILEMGKVGIFKKIFFPSTIAVFGHTTPRSNTPQDAPLLPTTVYGISKSTGELWCNYYFQRYGVDVRSLRYPGIIGWQSMPGGGTTDYAVDIFYAALASGKYESFLSAKTRLPMMYMDDAIKATIQIMEAPTDQISIRYGYNLAAMSFTPEEIAAEIKKHLPDFEISYKPDFRQAIADSWTESINDSKARNDWGWQPDFDLPKMISEMLFHLKNK